MHMHGLTLSEFFKHLVKPVCMRQKISLQLFIIICIGSERLSHTKSNSGVPCSPGTPAIGNLSASGTPAAPRLLCSCSKRRPLSKISLCVWWAGGLISARLATLGLLENTVLKWLRSSPCVDIRVPSAVLIFTNSAFADCVDKWRTESM